jgi:cytolethal distending toxin subunit A
MSALSFRSDFAAKLLTAVLLTVVTIDASHADNGPKLLINGKTGKCLTIAGGTSPANNLTAVQFDCDGDLSRSWHFNRVGDSFQIQNAKTGKCLTIAGGTSPANNLKAVQFDCDGDLSRSWHFNRAGAAFQVQNAKTGKCLTIAGGTSPANNLEAVQFDCDSDLSRTWRVNGQ